VAHIIESHGLLLALKKPLDLPLISITTAVSNTPNSLLRIITLSEFIQTQNHQPPPSSTNTSSSNLSTTSTTQATPNCSSESIKMAFGRRRNQVVTRETKPTLLTRLRGRNARTRTVKTTETVHPAGRTTGHTTASHHTTARRSRWGGRNTRTAQPVPRHRRHASIGDKISGAMLKLKGSLTHRPGVKAAGTRRMHGTDGRGSHRTY